MLALGHSPTWSCSLWVHLASCCALDMSPSLNDLAATICDFVHGCHGRKFSIAAYRNFVTNHGVDEWLHTNRCILRRRLAWHRMTLIKFVVPSTMTIVPNSPCRVCDSTFPKNTTCAPRFLRRSASTCAVLVRGHLVVWSWHLFHRIGLHHS